VDTAPHRFFGLVHPSACLITDCSGWPIVFLVVLLGFHCFGPANVECFLLSLLSVPCTVSIVLFYCTLFAPWQTDAGSKNNIRECELHILRSA